MGLIPGAGGTASIPRRIGRQRAAYMAISGADIDLATALAWGLVDAERRVMNPIGRHAWRCAARARSRALTGELGQRVDVAALGVLDRRGLLALQPPGAVVAEPRLPAVPRRRRLDRRSTSPARRTASSSRPGCGCRDRTTIPGRRSSACQRRAAAPASDLIEGDPARTAGGPGRRGRRPNASTRRLADGRGAAAAAAARCASSTSRRSGPGRSAARSWRRWAARGHQG